MFSFLLSTCHLWHPCIKGHGLVIEDLMLFAGLVAFNTFSTRVLQVEDHTQTLFHRLYMQNIVQTFIWSQVCCYCVNIVICQVCPYVLQVKNVLMVGRFPIRSLLVLLWYFLLLPAAAMTIFFFTQIIHQDFL